MTACWKEGCVGLADLSVTAAGYPAAMGKTCRRHLVEFLDADLAHPGSTEAWVVRDEAGGRTWGIAAC